MLNYIAAILLASATTIQGAPRAYDKIVECLTSSGVPQELPGTPAFSQGIIPYNLRLNFTPVALAVPSTVPQVQEAVKCGAKLGVKVNPRSGGHSYASHSIGGEDGHLVVDLKYFRDTKVDPSTNIATIGSGARLGNVALDLFNQGGRALAHGICPGVGVGGHVLHGGQGYSSHSHGLFLDFLTEAEVVVADGSVVTASESQNSDLFWALKGAGMSFGIVTNFKFRTFAAPTENVLFYYPYSWNRAQARSGWQVWQNYCAGLTTPQIPTEMNIRMVIVQDTVENLLFLIEGAYHGSQSAFLAAIAPLLTALNAVGGLKESIRGVGAHTLGWLDSLLYANSNGLYSDWDNKETLNTTLNYTAHSTFFAKSLMTNNLSPAGLDGWVRRVFATGINPPTGWYIIIAAQGGPTSAVPKFNTSSSSYAHRNSIYEWQLVAQTSSPPFPDDGLLWLNLFAFDLEFTEEKNGSKVGMYYNYADPALTKEESGGRYWLGNYERLVQLKKKLDPTVVFSNPQTVGN